MNDLFVMNMKRKILFVCLAFLALLQGWAQHTWQAGPVNLELIQRGNSEFPSGFSAFSLKNRFIWCGSAIQAEEDGKYYLFYSAMKSGPKYPRFIDAWLLGSMIGVAVSDSPYGGYKDIGIVYNKDGYRPDSCSWDAQSVHNPHIKRYNGKYYLYYCATVDPGGNAHVKGKLSRRDRLQQNQKLGVLCFNSIKELLEGKFSCNEQPLLAPRTRDIGIVYNKDGYRPDSCSWDAQSVHNPHIKRYNGKYYLYYCATVDPGGNAHVKGKLSRRDRLQQNQKLGVLCFNSIKELLEGKFSCNEQPLLAPRTRVKPDNVLEPSPEGTVTKPDNLILVNPAVVYHPLKKKYYLYFKGNVYDPTWRGVHGVAIADAPEGPFIVQDDYVFEFETGDNQKLNAEDPFVWYHRKDNCFYAVFKDFTGGFTKGKPGLAIMYAEDGIHWELPEHSLFMNKEIILKNGERLEVDRLERPQLLLDENDEPIVLYSACSITPLNMKQDGSSFNIQIPILRNK